MIIINIFELFYFLITKVSYNDFVKTFAYFVLLTLLIKAARSLIHA